MLVPRPPRLRLLPWTTVGHLGAIPTIISGVTVDKAPKQKQNRSKLRTSLRSIEQGARGAEREDEGGRGDCDFQREMKIL